MARYTGPVCRICRRMGEKLFLKGERCITKCAWERRQVPPGGRSQRRRRVSERGTQLKEKQRVRYMYGLLERQFRKNFVEAERRSGITGENLLQLLELRMDNVTFRLGFADSRRQARQLVSHGHLAVNGRTLDIPSAKLKTGDIITWTERGRAHSHYQEAIQGLEGRSIPSWLSLDAAAMTGRVTAAPSRGEIEQRINEQAIVEYYSR